MIVKAFPKIDAAPAKRFGDNGEEQLPDKKAPYPCPSAQEA